MFSIHFIHKTSEKQFIWDKNFWAVIVIVEKNMYKCLDIMNNFWNISYYSITFSPIQIYKNTWKYKIIIMHLF